MLAPTFSSLSLFNGPTSHNRLDYLGVKRGESGADGGRDGRAGELDTRVLRETERLPRALKQHLTAEVK